NKLRRNEINDRNMALVKKLPEIKIPNKFFSNNGDMKFTDMGADISDNRSTYSNGAVYADLDNDGDLDIVVSNIDDPVLVYENKNNDKGNNSFVDVSLKGPEKNINAIGAKIIEFSGEQIRTYENYPVRGFQSSMQVPIHIGLERTKIDSMFLIWPDNSCQPVLLNGKDHINFTYTKGLPLFDYSKTTSFRSNRTRPMEN